MSIVVATVVGVGVYLAVFAALDVADWLRTRRHRFDGLADPRVLTPVRQRMDRLRSTDHFPEDIP